MLFPIPRGREISLYTCWPNKQEVYRATLHGIMSVLVLLSTCVLMILYLFPMLNKRFCLPIKKKRNVIFTIFSQKILSSGLLLVVIGGQKSNLICGFKLKLIITYHIFFVVKIL